MIGANQGFIGYELTRIDISLLKPGWEFPPKTSISMSLTNHIGSNQYCVKRVLTTPQDFIQLYEGTKIYPTKSREFFRNPREDDEFKDQDNWELFEFSILNHSSLTLSVFINWLAPFDFRMLHNIVATRMPRTNPKNIVDIDLDLSSFEDLSVLFE